MISVLPHDGFFAGFRPLIDEGFLSAIGIQWQYSEDVQAEKGKIEAEKHAQSLDEIVFRHLVQKIGGIVSEIAEQGWNSSQFYPNLQYMAPVHSTTSQFHPIGRMHNITLPGVHKTLTQYSPSYSRIFPSEIGFYAANPEYEDQETTGKYAYNLDGNHGKSAFFGFPYSIAFGYKGKDYRITEPYKLETQNQPYTLNVRINTINSVDNSATLYIRDSLKAFYNSANTRLAELSETKPANYKSIDQLADASLMPRQAFGFFKTHLYKAQQSLISEKYQNAIPAQPHNNPAYAKYGLQARIGPMPVDGYGLRIHFEHLPYTIDTLINPIKNKNTEIPYLSQITSSVSGKKPANDNERQYVTDGRVIDGVYVAFEGKIGQINADAGSYLQFIKNILIQEGYSVEIVAETYFDPELKRNVRGSRIVDMDNPKMHYHIIINGKLPDYKNGEDNPLALRNPMAGDYVKILRHNEDMPYIDSPEFRNENPLKKEQCFVSGKNPIKMAA